MNQGPRWCALLSLALLTSLAVPQPSAPHRTYRWSQEPQNIPFPRASADWFLFPPPFIPPCCPSPMPMRACATAPWLKLTCCSQISTLILCLMRRDKTPTLTAAPHHGFGLLSQSFRSNGSWPIAPVSLLPEWISWTSRKNPPVTIARNHVFLGLSLGEVPMVFSATRESARSFWSDFSVLDFEISTKAIADGKGKTTPNPTKLPLFSVHSFFFLAFLFLSSSPTPSLPWAAEAASWKRN